MEAVANQKYIHTTPRKLRLVVAVVQKMTPDQALVALQFTPKLAAKALLKVIKTVVANAKQKGMGNLIFKKIEINEAPSMKRFRPGTKGRVKPYKKRMSHIKIVLTDDLNVKTQKSKVKIKTKNPKIDEIKARTGQYGNESELQEGGRTGLSK